MARPTENQIKRLQDFLEEGLDVSFEPFIDKRKASDVIGARFNKTKAVKKGDQLTLEERLLDYWLLALRYDNLDELKTEQKWRALDVTNAAH